MKFINWLKSSRAAVDALGAEEKHSTLHVVLGNQSADCDSTVCALALSYALSRSRTKDEQLDDIVHVGVINCLREDFCLRTDTSALLKMLNIDADMLTFVGDIAPNEDALVAVSLVDHNALCPAQSGWSERVVSIIDHHADSKAFDKEKVPCWIETVGSCASLIAQLLSSEKSRQEEYGVLPLLNVEEDTTLARLLLAAILVDTCGLDPLKKRATQRDIDACNVLTKMVGWSDEQRDAHYVDLDRAKFDCSALSSRDLLRRDYKQFDVEGVSFVLASVTLSPEKWQERGDVEESVLSFNDELASAFLIVHTLQTKPTFSRGIVLFCSDSAKFEKLKSFFKGEKCADLKLHPIDGLFSAKNIVAFNQTNTAMSRKNVSPIIVDYIKTTKL